MIRVVVDANVLLAGVVSPSESPPALLLNPLEQGRLEAIACPRLLQELQHGLDKPFFSERLNVERARQVVQAVESAALMLPDPVDAPRVVRDPDDDYVVALAKDAGADAIVSGDRDLLDEPRLDPPVLNPRAACIKLGLLKT